MAQIGTSSENSSFSALALWFPAYTSYNYFHLNSIEEPKSRINEHVAFLELVQRKPFCITINTLEQNKTIFKQFWTFQTFLSSNTFLLIQTKMKKLKITATTGNTNWVATA